MRRVTADSDTLMRQAPMTAQFYLDEAIELLKKEKIADPYGIIIGAFMITSSIDLLASTLTAAIEESRD